MTDRSTIEFWEVEGGEPKRCLINLTTDAPPPLVSQMVNISKVDYEVVQVDYSIDQHSRMQRTYRRNVMMERRS